VESSTLKKEGKKSWRAGCEMGFIVSTPARTRALDHSGT
jgi:hypothetical protein